MDAQNADIAGLVRTVIEPLIDDPENLVVDEVDQGDGDILIEVHVSEADAGKVIGRQGRVIKAIRTLARSAASRAGMQHVDVELID